MYSGEQFTMLHDHRTAHVGKIDTYLDGPIEFELSEVNGGFAFLLESGAGFSIAAVVVRIGEFPLLLQKSPADDDRVDGIVQTLIIVHFENCRLSRIYYCISIN